MTKKSAKKDPLDRVGRKLARAQLELHVAQAKRADAVTRGEQDVEAARERAARRVARATKRVERAAGQVARAQARLASVSTLAAAQRSRWDERRRVRATPPESPAEVVAAVLEAAQEQHPTPPGELFIPDGTQIVTGRETERDADPRDGVVEEQ